VIDANQGGGGGWDPAPQVQQTIAVFPIAELVFNPAAVEIGPGSYNWGTSLTAQGLSPNSAILICEGSSTCEDAAAANASGSTSLITPLGNFACGEETFPLYWKGTAADGKAIESTPVTESPCPGA
jgi:hypothetical protein